MQCIECGHVLADKDSFCTGCGKKVEFSKALIDRAVQGDDEAQTQIYNETYQSAYTQVRSMVRDEDAALDILQDSYVKAFRSLAQLKEPNKFRAWLKTITHNRTMDYFRERKSLVFSEAVSADAEEVEIEIVDDYPDRQPEVVMDRQETERLIDEILNDLPEEQRAVISMFYYEQQSVEEIAAELGVSKNTVKSRLNYGRKKVESEVRALEKKGTKLYGLAPIPFLLMLFQRMEVQAAELPAGLWKRIKLRLPTKPAGIKPEGQKLSGAKIREVLEDHLAKVPTNADFSKVIPMLTQPLAIKIIAAVALLLVASVMVRVISGNRNTPAPPSQSVSTQSEDAEAPSSTVTEAQQEEGGTDIDELFPQYTPDVAEVEARGRRIAAEIWDDTPVTEYVQDGIHFYVPDEYPLQTKVMYSGEGMFERTVYYWDSGVPMPEEEKTNNGIVPVINDNWNVAFDIGGSPDAVHFYGVYGDTVFGVEVGNITASASGEGFTNLGFHYINLPQSVREFPFNKVIASAWAEKTQASNDTFEYHRMITYYGSDTTMMTCLPVLFDASFDRSRADSATSVIQAYRNDDDDARHPITFHYAEYRTYSNSSYRNLKEIEEEHGMPYERNNTYYNSSERYYLTLEKHSHSLKNNEQAWSYIIRITDKQPGEWSSVTEYEWYLSEYTPETSKRAVFDLIAAFFGDGLLPAYETLPQNSPGAVIEDYQPEEPEVYAADPAIIAAGWDEYMIQIDDLVIDYSEAQLKDILAQFEETGRYTYEDPQSIMLGPRGTMEFKIKKKDDPVIWIRCLNPTDKEIPCTEGIVLALLMNRQGDSDLVESEHIWFPGGYCAKNDGHSFEEVTNMLEENEDQFIKVQKTFAQFICDANNDSATRYNGNLATPYSGTKGGRIRYRFNFEDGVLVEVYPEYESFDFYVVNDLEEYLSR